MAVVGEEEAESAVDGGEAADGAVVGLPRY